MLCLCAALLGGCDRGDVQVYKVAKEHPEVQPMAADPSGAPPMGRPETASAPPSLKWQLPPGWEEVPPGEIRLASFKVQGQEGKTADVSIIPLPGLAGTDLDNVNRWRGQVGLPPVTAEELPKLATPVEITGQQAQLYDQAGKLAASGEKGRILAALMRHEGVAWFFKMTGDDALVEQQKPVFVGFLQSLSFVAAPPAELPPSHPPIGDMSNAAPPPASAASARPDKPAWQVPAGWQEVPGGDFLAAKFLITGADKAQAAVNVSVSPGDGGGVVGNVNRWRRQLGLAELSEGDIKKLVTPVESPAGKGVLADLTGTDAKTGQKARLVGVILPQASQTWFYKLMGNEQVVGREREAFTQFVQTAKYPHAP